MDANYETMTFGAIRERLIEKAVEDETFRARLLAEPKETVQDELGLQAPEGFTLMVHEETADTSHLVLPPSAKLDEGALAQAAGGGGGKYWYHGSAYW